MGHVPAGTLGGDLPVARPAHPTRSEGVPLLFTTTGAKAVGRRLPEDPQATTNPSRTAIYYYPTDR